MARIKPMVHIKCVEILLNDHNMAMIIVLVIALIGFSIPTLIRLATP